MKDVVKESSENLLLHRDAPKKSKKETAKEKEMVERKISALSKRRRR